MSMISSHDFRLLLESSPHPYLILLPDDAFTIGAVNDRYLAVTGTHRDQIVGKGLFEVFPDNPDDTRVQGVSDLRASLQRVRQDGVQDVMGVQKYDIPVRSGGADGGAFETRYWSPVNTPVFDEQRQIRYIIHHVEDITEFVLAREQAAAATSTAPPSTEPRVERMEAEILHRAAELKESNRQLKIAKEQIEHREAELARLNEQLTELDRPKTEFFSNVSHEFRTPLSLMLSPLEQLLERPPASPADAHASLWIAHRNALRLLKLVNTLLDFSRIEAQRLKPQRQYTDLSALSRDLASGFRSMCERAGLEFVVSCPPLPHAVAVDRGMWEKIVLNLLSNAFKFTYAGHIEVRLRMRDGFVELEVIDTGVGIAESDLPRLFERFYRVSGAAGRSQEGSGIGLALVDEMARLHGGSVSVRSRVGHGSAFTVRIPAVAGENPGTVAADRLSALSAFARSTIEEASRWLADDASSPPAAMPADKTGMTGWRILIADDNHDMRDYLRKLLEDAGFQVRTVNDGNAALAACLSDAPDLLLSDVMMPGLNGIALLQRIRIEPSIANLPVILLSARADEAAQREGLGATPDDYVVKPFHASELIARIENALRLARFRATANARDRLGRAMMESTSEGVLVTDESIRIIAVNPAFTEITGYSAKETIGQRPRFLSALRTPPGTYASMWETLNATGCWRGELWNRRKNGEIFLERLTINSIAGAGRGEPRYVGVFSDVTELRARDEHLQHLAFYDALTDLPNRQLFRDRLRHALARAQRERKRVGLLYIDLDHFKAVNDTLGHDAGDVVLQNAASRLHSNVRAMDTVARLGGDEFVVILEDIEGPADCAPAADKIVVALAKPVETAETAMPLGASVGIAVFPEDAGDAETLIQAADRAMYEAKAAGGNRHCFFTPPASATSPAS